MPAHVDPGRLWLPSAARAGLLVHRPARDTRTAVLGAQPRGRLFGRTTTSTSPTSERSWSMSAGDDPKDRFAAYRLLAERSTVPAVGRSCWSGRRGQKTQCGEGGAAGLGGVGEDALPIALGQVQHLVM